MTAYDTASFGLFIRVGVVGCGRVGRAICLGIDSGDIHVDLEAVCDTDPEKVQSLIFSLNRPTRSMSLHGLVASVDLVIEATNRHIAPVVIMNALDGGKDVLVTNTAALFARDDFARLAQERGLTIYAANALLTGVNALNMAAASDGAEIKLTITCPSQVLAAAPFLRGRKLDPRDKPQLVFQGESGDAMAAFPVLANLVASAVIGAGGATPLVRVRAHDARDVTDIELLVSAQGQQTRSRVRVPSGGAEPVDAQAIGRLVIGFLKSLIDSVRLV